MPYQQDTLKLVVGGKLSQDIWRCSFDFRVQLVGLLGPTAANLNDILNTKWNTALDTWWSQIKLRNTSVVDYSFTALYWYPLGNTASSAVGMRTQTPSAGTGSSGQIPLRSCLAVTKRTNFAGRANRGRVYVPITAATALDAANQYAVGDVSLYVQRTGDLLNALNAVDISADAIATQDACVTSSSAVASGNVITRLTGDSLPDTQRRRTNKDQSNSSSSIIIT